MGEPVQSIPRQDLYKPRLQDLAGLHHLADDQLQIPLYTLSFLVSSICDILLLTITSNCMKFFLVLVLWAFVVAYVSRAQSGMMIDPNTPLQSPGSQDFLHDAS